MTKNSETPLFFAAVLPADPGGSRLEPLKFLVENGASPFEGAGILHAMCDRFRWDDEVASYLCGLGLDVNALDESGHTALHTAAKRGYARATRSLVDILKADVNIENIDGRTALDIAEMWRPPGLQSSWEWEGYNKTNEILERSRLQ